MNDQTPYNDLGQENRPAEIPPLDRNIPKLDAGISRKINRKALMFVGVIGACGLLLALTMFKQFTNKWTKAGEGKPKEKEELVIPERPIPRGVQPPVVPDLDRAAESGQPALPPIPGLGSLQNTLTQNLNGVAPAAVGNATTPANANPADMLAGLPSIPMASAMPTVTKNGSKGMATGASYLSDKDKPPSLTDKRLNSGGVIGSDAGTPGSAAAIPGGMMAPANGLAGSMFGQAPGNSQPAQVSAAAQRVSQLKNPNTLLVRGTYIRCTLESKIVSDLNGFTTCVTTEPVYSVNGRRLLIPRGSKISGMYGGNGSGSRDQSYDRLGVIWDRVITPTGLDVTLNSPGIDNLGGAGHPGEYDAHWFQRLGAAVMVSMIGDVFNYQATVHGPKIQKSYVDTATGKVTVVEEPFDSKTVETLSKIPEKVLAQTMNRAPTITIHQGEMLNIYTAQDIDFSKVLDD